MPVQHPLFGFGAVLWSGLGALTIENGMKMAEGSGEKDAEERCRGHNVISKLPSAVECICQLLQQRLLGRLLSGIVHSERERRKGFEQGCQLQRHSGCKQAGTQ